ncbi:MAG: FxsA family protein [Pseudomonadota bacterium]
MRLFLILLAVPVIEIGLFIEIGGWLGTWPTIGLVVLTALIGSILLRQQGVAALRDFQGRLAAGENPGRLLADGAMILVAGALLLTPGFFTDAVGFLLLIPGIRRALWNWGKKHIKPVQGQTFASGGATWHFQTGGHSSHPGGQTVDGTYSEAEPEPEARPETPHLNKDKSGPVA